MVGHTTIKHVCRLLWYSTVHNEVRSRLEEITSVGLEPSGKGAAADPELAEILRLRALLSFQLMVEFCRSYNNLSAY